MIPKSSTYGFVTSETGGNILYFVNGKIYNYDIDGGVFGTQLKTDVGDKGDLVFEKLGADATYLKIKDLQLKVDHIGEATTSHNIVCDSNLAAASFSSTAVSDDYFGYFAYDGTTHNKLTESGFKQFLCFTCHAGTPTYLK